MDIELFLKERTNFARYFYTNASIAFIKTMSAIENEEEPYIPLYSEDGVPTFLSEWLQARDGLSSVGLATISMLSSAIQLFLSSWTDRIESQECKFDRKGKKGWLNAYKAITIEFGANYLVCPASFDLIEQTVLARNRTQHVEEIAILGVSHSESDLAKYPSPYFISDEDRASLPSQSATSWWIKPNIHIDESKLEQVIVEIEKYCSWLESEYERVLSARRAAVK